MDLLVPGSPDGAQGRPRAAGAMVPPGRHSPSSSKDRSSCWDLSQCSGLVKPTRSQVPLCSGAVLSMHGAELLAGVSGHSPLSSFVSPFHSPVSCSGHHAVLHPLFPKEAGLVPWQGQQDVQVMQRGNLGAAVAPCPDSLCRVPQVSSAAHHGNDCQLILHYFSDADQLLNCCK